MSHSITPPLELVMQWSNASPIPSNDENWAYELFIADQASKWAADQELDACCAFAQDQTWGLVNGPQVADVIRAARRPKPPSLKEQALIHFESFAATFETSGGDSDLIRRALEQLPNCE